MKFEELIVLLPCYSLEDFPVYYEGSTAEGLLAAWSALWHPTLLANAGRIPVWRRADSPPDQLANRLILIPPASEPLLPLDWVETARNENAHLVTGLHSRREMVAAMLELLEAHGGATPRASDDLTGDVHALGLCYLLVELLTRLMRNMSHVDELRLQKAAVGASEAALAGDDATARERLREAFEALTEARERYYPVDAFLIDLTLMAETTLGEAFRKDLALRAPQNVLITGELIERMAEREPASLAALREAVEAKTVCIVGGEWREEELPLRPPEAALRNLRRGRQAYLDKLSTAPTIYARRRNGLTPFLPQWLLDLGYQGAVHFTLDDGRFPPGDQSKSQWTGVTVTAIDALHRLPLDAGKPASFLSLPQRLGESMDLDYVATLVFARWPGATCEFFEDLRRSAHYGAPLGRFVTLEDYFFRTEGQGSSVRFRADEYRSPYLRQSVAAKDPDPLSRHVRAHEEEARRYTLASLATIAAVASGNAKLAESIDDEHGEISLDETTRRAAEALGAKPADSSSAGILAINPLSVSRTLVVETPGWTAGPAIEAPVVAAQIDEQGVVALVEAPAMGFAWLAPGQSQPPPKRRRRRPPPTIVEGMTLRNEFMEVTLHPEFGGIRSLYGERSRHNRLSQQLAFRLPTPPPKPGDIWRDPDETAEYTVAACDGFETTRNGTVLGEVQTHGRLLDRDGARVATFRQTFRLARGSRVLELTIEIEPTRTPTGDPWLCYYASRFAWANSSSDIYASAAGTRQPTEARRIEAPQFVEIRDADQSVTILTGGLPYHRRVGFRMLDTLVQVAGELTRRYRIGIGVDLAHPAQEAAALLTPSLATAATSPPAPQGWIFHIRPKNIVATHWSPLVVDGRVRGFRARLLETEGKSGEVRLRALRNVQRATQVDFRGEVVRELAVDADAVTLEIGAFEWREIEVTMVE